MSTAAAKTTTAAQTANTAPDAGEFMMIDIGCLVPSKTNPRKVFHAKPLDELAASIKANGVIEPIVVRSWAAKPRQTKNGTDYDKTFEIIAGERRFKASTKAGLAQVPCLVRKLTDEQVLDVQIDENWHRQDLEPMDEARGLKHLQQTLKLSVDEIAARLSKPVTFVHRRLKLNDLIEPFQKAMDKGIYPVSHAYIVARYAEDKQKVILKEAYSGKITENNAEHNNLEWAIERHVEVRLASAPFSLNDDRLRKDGLKCGDCKTRAGANPTLFEVVDAKHDRCLDATCFRNKTTAFVQIGRNDMSEAGKAKHGPDYVAPVIVYAYASDSLKRQHKDAISHNTYREDDYNSDNSKKCTGSETAMYINSDGSPSKKYICRDHQCPRHWKKKGKSSAGKGEDLSGRKEEIFDTKVREPLRQRVLIEAAPRFAKTFVLKCDSPAFLADLVDRTYGQAGYNDDVCPKLIDPFLKALKKKVPEYYQRTGWAAKNLTPVEMAAVVFLWTNGRKGEMMISGSYSSQAAIIALAIAYGIDYRLLDAERRLEECKNKKQRVGLEEYLAKVKAGEKAAIPRFWKPDYVADDSVDKGKD